MTSSKKAGPSPSKVPLPQASSKESLPELLETLSSRLSETESSLSVLLDGSASLSEAVESLPVLDRAKFFVTLAYAIDSLIFCYIRTKGASFKDHPVMQELERVKNYIRKVNAAEQVPTDRNIVVNQEAAQRVILHSIPKSQIVPDPKATANGSEVRSRASSTSTQKKTVKVSSTEEEGSEEGEVRTKKKKRKKDQGASSKPPKKAKK